MGIEHRYPHAIVRCKSITSRQHEDLIAITGIRYRKWKKDYIIPHHALPLADNFFQAQAIEITAHWGMRARDKNVWSHYEAQLRNSELQDWVLDGFLTQYQISAIECTGHMRGCHFWHPTGAGKTLSAILWSLLSDGPVVAVTRAASRLQFGREFERFTHLKPYVIRPLTKKKQKTLDDYLLEMEDKEERPVIIVGWESLANNVDTLDFVLSGLAGSVIFDESHRGKSAKRWEKIPLPEYEGDSEKERKRFYDKQNKEAKRRNGFVPDSSEYEQRVMMVPAENMTSAASRLAKIAGRVVCTTATPIKDRVRDLWAQLDLAEPYSWGSARSFHFRYCNAKPNKYGGLDTSGESNLDELKDRLLHSTHSIDYRDTHRQLPAKRRQSFYISPEDQCRATAGFAKELKGAAKRGGTALLEVRLAQAASKKRRAILDLIADHVSSNHKVVVFSGRRRDVDGLGDALKKHPVCKKHDTTIWAAHGGVDASERQKIVDKYMSHSGQGGAVLVGTGDAFGESLNLQDTDAALFVMLPYTAGQIRQWEGRFCRLGQKRPVTIYYCICEDSVDEHIADILISKMGAVERVIGDEELAEARFAIGGIDDEDEILSSILLKMGETDE